MKLLREKIADFQQRTRVARKKTNKIKRMSERIMKEHKLSVLLEKQYNNEESEGKPICMKLIYHDNNEV